MPTQVLYMEDRRGQEPDPCYLREFDATVLERGPDFVVLDRTAFYAEGGGQPYDTGSLSWSGGEAKVLRVTKEKGVIRHHVDRLPPEGAVRGIIDWDRRYAHMRYHTSQHLLSGLVWKIYAARTVGNRLFTDRPGPRRREAVQRKGDGSHHIRASAEMRRSASRRTSSGHPASAVRHGCRGHRRFMRAVRSSRSCFRAWSA